MVCGQLKTWLQATSWQEYVRLATASLLSRTLCTKSARRCAFNAVAAQEETPLQLK